LQLHENRLHRSSRAIGGIMIGRDSGGFLRLLWRN